MFKGIFIVFFLFLTPSVLGNMKLIHGDQKGCYNSVVSSSNNDDSPQERIHKIARDFSNEKVDEVRKKMAVDFMKHFYGDNSFVLVDPVSIYLIGKGLSDKNPDIKLMFASAAKYAYEKDLPVLENINEIIYNPYSLDYILKYFQGLSYEDFVGDRNRRASFFHKMKQFYTKFQKDRLLPFFQPHKPSITQDGFKVY